MVRAQMWQKILGTKTKLLNCELGEVGLGTRAIVAKKITKTKSLNCELGQVGLCTGASVAKNIWNYKKVFEL